MYKYALIGLAAMGSNLARNFASKGISIAVYNRTTERMQEFIELHGSDLLTGFTELAELVKNIERPRKIILMVKAGSAVDAVIAELLPLLEAGDIIIDGGNSHYPDTQRRFEELQAKGISFVGMGISGGAEGALYGPSLMPGATTEIYRLLAADLQQIAAADFKAGKTVTRFDPAAGHFVKMVHNGIEYAIMQTIAEVYAILKTAGEYSNEQIADCFERWQATHLNSFLLEITIKILRTKDIESGKDLVDLILDQPESKGTAGWTLEAGILTNTPLPTIAAAVYARSIFANKESRVSLARIPEYHQPPVQIKVSEAQLATLLLQTSLLSFHQGLSLISAASSFYSWSIDLAEVCRIWQGGCIIRAKYLADLQSIYSQHQDLLQSDFYRTQLQTSEQLAKYLAQLNQLPIPLLAINSAQDYLKALTLANSPANLLQAQRDFFGQHTYKRVDQERVVTGGWE